MLAILRHIQPPNSVSVVAQAAATAAISDQQFVKYVREETAIVRDWFMQRLKALGLNPQRSVCNFVLCRLSSAEAAQALAENKQKEAELARSNEAQAREEAIL